jgi:hypothetical protein
MSRHIVLSPIGDLHVAEASVAPTLQTLEGRRVGFLDNTKLNAQALLRVVESWFRRERSTTTAAWATKLTAAGPMSDAVFEELRAECEAVVTGVGD